MAADVGTRNAILGVRYEGAPWLYLSVSAPLDSTAFPWAAAGVGGRLDSALGPAEAGIDLGGHAYGYRERTLDAAGGGLTLQALPFLAIARGDARLELRSGLLHYGSSFDGVRISRTVHDNGARLSFWPDARLRVSGEGRYVRAEEGDYPYAGAGLDLALPGGEVWAYAGRWLSDVLDGPVWGAGGSLRVSDRLSLRAAVEQEADDPLYWNGPRQSWSIGLSHSLGGAPELPAPVPVVPELSGGRVTLRLPVDEAETAPSVGGDFNAWEPVPMQRSGDHWVATFPVEPGVYQYAFQRADGSWFVPESVPNRVDDGFGGENAVLVVAGS